MNPMNLMSLTNLMNFKLKHLLKDLRRAELRWLIATVLFSVLCVSSITFFTEGIKAGLEDETGTLLGGDRVLSSPIPISTEILDKAKILGLQTSQTVTFYSMLLKDVPQTQMHAEVQPKAQIQAQVQTHTQVHTQNNNSINDNPLALAEVKAVDEQYPLKGELHGSKTLYGEDEILKKIPEAGTVWLEADLFSLLNIDIGDSINIGYLPLQVTAVLTFEPDRGGEGLNYAPRALLNLNDLEKTKVISPGSRQNYKLLLSGSQKSLDIFEDWLKPKLTMGQKFTQSKEARPVVKNVLDQSESYLNLIIILNLIIAILALSQAARRYSWRQYQFIAIIRCFGGSFRWIFNYFMMELVVYNILATSVGFLLGALFYYFSKGFFEELLAQNIQIHWTKPLYVSIITGLILTVIFAFLTLLKLKKVSPTWIFRQRRGRVEAGLSKGFPQWKNIINRWSASYGVGFRYGVNHLLRYPLENTIQILAFSMVMICAWLLFLLRTDLIHTWQKQTKVDAPNYFVINIFPDARDKFYSLLEKNHIKVEKLYPIVRGRLIAINDESLESKEGIKRGRTQLRRLLNLTYDNQIPVDNEVIAGAWFSEKDQGKPFVSLEQGFAERMDIKLNDKLSFQIEGKEWEVRVKSLRKVIWDTFHPNFFVIFPEKVLDELPFTYITSFYLDPSKRFLLRELIQAFPEINLIDMSLILKNIGNMILKLSFAVEYLWALTGIMAFVLLFCTLAVNLEERRDNAILFRILGVSRKKLWSILLSEFFILGGISGFLATVVASVIYLYIGTHIFNFSVKVQPFMFLLGPIMGMALISFGSYISLRKVFMVTPLRMMTLR